MNKTIKHSDYLVAIQPLLDLIGIASNEIMASVHITPSDGMAVANIDLLVAARAVDDAGERPRFVRNAEGLLPPADETSVFVWPLRVAVV
jgi:hypothetical protein